MYLWMKAVALLQMGGVLSRLHYVSHPRWGFLACRRAWWAPFGDAPWRHDYEVLIRAERTIGIDHWKRASKASLADPTVSGQNGQQCCVLLVCLECRMIYYPNLYVSEPGCFVVVEVLVGALKGSHLVEMVPSPKSCCNLGNWTVYSLWRGLEVGLGGLWADCYRMKWSDPYDQKLGSRFCARFLQSLMEKRPPWCSITGPAQLVDPGREQHRPWRTLGRERTSLSVEKA